MSVGEHNKNCQHTVRLVLIQKDNFLSPRIIGIGKVEGIMQRIVSIVKME